MRSKVDPDPFGLKRKHLVGFFGILFSEMPSVRTTDTTLDQATLKDIESIAVGAGVQPSPFMSGLELELRNVPDPSRALNNLDRFLHTSFAVSTIRDFATHRVLLQIALDLFSQSQFLSDILVRNPELFRWLTTTPVLNTTKERIQYVNGATQVIELFQRTERKLDALKRYHRRELLRLGAREILGEATIPTVTAELSWLADAIVEAVLRIVVQQLEMRSGLHFEHEFAVIGLGKLGGEELNFSSDIDLLFVYERDGEINLPLERIHTLHELYARMGEMIVRSLTERTSEGHLYRVDMRLRPDGSSGPIAMSRQAYRNYYEARGELWERQMLTKARVIAGNRAVGERWLDDIGPFVFPKTILRSPLAEIYEMKQKIEAKVEEKENIKLGTGGIRDIEFIVQGLELLHGGSDEQLRQNNTLRAIETIVLAKKLTDDEAETLSKAYLFLRSVEHRLQLLHGLQTHSLPESSDEKLQLSRRLGFKTTAEFENSLERHRKAVSAIFKSFFKSPVSDVTKAGDESVKEIHIHAAKVLEELGIDKEVGLRDLFIESLKRYGVPSLALENFSTLVQPKTARILAEAMKNRHVVDLLLLVCSRSSIMTQRLAREPLLLESLLGQTDRILSHGFEWEFLRATDLYRFREYNEFKSALRFLLGKSDIHVLRKELTLLAEEIINFMFLSACEYVSQNIVLPSMSVVALGRLGSGGLIVGSDLDLIILYDDSNRDAGSSQPDGSLAGAERVIKEFLRKNEGEQGRVYEIDLRLRPEGKNAPLAVGMDYFRSYFVGRAALWERQMLTRARVLSGDEKIKRSLRRLVCNIAFLGELPEGWTAEILAMRRRMEKERVKEGEGLINLKLDRGGITDVEFLIQSIQLRQGAKQKKLQSPNEVEVLRHIRATKMLSRSKVEVLEKNYDYLQTLETFVRLNSNASTLPNEGRMLEFYAAAMGEKSSAALLRRLRSVQKENRKMFMETLQRWKKK